MDDFRTFLSVDDVFDVSDVVFDVIDVSGVVFDVSDVNDVSGVVLASVFSVVLGVFRRSDIY